MESFAATILIVDDDSDIREVLKDRLEAFGYSVLLASGGKEGLERLERQNPHIVLLDVEMPDMNGLEFLKEIQKRETDVTVVMITAYGTIEKAVEAIKQGAYDFIPKPFEPDYISHIVQKALERESLKRGLDVLSEQVCEKYQLVTGKSIKMRKALDMARTGAASRSTVLLLGESGTGKEIFARGIHNWSERKNGPFIAINCVGLSKELLESELFGHERGAFTGAHQLKKGKLELAHRGTILLDEVGDISPELQTKLLRFLQEREFERVGGTATIRVDVRIVAATNKDLEKAVAEHHFREDLYYRLNVIPISLPPLRERKEDIPLLAEHFLRRFSSEIKKAFVGMTQEAQEKLQAYDWPGNVRELANVIERAVVLGQGPNVSLQDLPRRISAARLWEKPDSRSFSQAINFAKRELIETALRETQGNRSAAAKLLGLQRSYLSRLIKSLHIN